MGGRVKKLFTNTILVLFTLLLNFGIFLYAYKKLTFPFLHEAQRMENAPYIFTYVLLGFFVSALVSLILIVWANRNKA